jgi:OmpR family response regulator RpaB
MYCTLYAKRYALKLGDFMDELKQKTILVADDDPDSVVIITLRLEAGDYRVTAAHDGEECMAFLESEQPDLLLLDVMMPRLNGYGVLMKLGELREAYPKLENMPVIVFTASHDAGVRIMMEKHQISGFITKPFEPKELMAKIRDAFAKIS